VAEYLSEEEQLAQLKSWWHRYGWWLVAGVVLGLGGYFVLQYLEGSRADTNAAASEVFERYQEAPSDDAAAKPLLARLDGEFAGTAYHLMSLMTRAQLASDAGDIEAAVGYYRRATDGEEIDHLTDVARLRLARALQQQGRGDDAINALGAVSGEGYRSLVAELKGDILYAQGDKGGARDAYRAAVDAQGDNPRTLLSMKLKNISAADGAAADPLVESEVDSEIVTETDADTVNDTPIVESEGISETVSETVTEAVTEAVSDIETQAEPEIIPTPEPQSN